MYQFVGHVVEDVHGGNAIGAVLPLTVDHDTRLLLEPRQVVVPLPVVQRITGRSRRGLGGGVRVQLVAVVTDADFELDGRVYRVDHCGGEEGSVELVLVSAEKWLQREDERRQGRETKQFDYSVVPECAINYWE